MRWFRDWVEHAEPVAYSMLALTPREFANLTPGEFVALADGALQRAERENELAAWLVVGIVNGVGMRKQPLRMEELLGVGYLRRLAERAEADRKKDS